MLPAAAPQKRGAAGTCSTLGCSHGLFMTRDPKMTLEKPSYFGVSVKTTLNWQRGWKKSRNEDVLRTPALANVPNLGQLARIAENGETLMSRALCAALSDPFGSRACFVPVLH